MANIAVAGLGIIGSIWARHYSEDGHQVRAWNRTPKAEFPGFVADLSEAVDGAQVVHICVSDPAAVRDVLEKMGSGLKRSMLVIQSSTISPRAASSFEEMVGATGAAYLEAPFTGSKPAAEKRDLVFFLGGEDAVVQWAVPYLEKLSRKRFVIGGVSQAAAIKLAMNLQIAAVSQALSEGWHLAGKYGLSHELFYEVLRENVACSGLAELKEPKLKTGDYTPQFSVKHMRKDLKLALEAAQGLNPRLTESLKDIYDLGMEEGLGDLDFIALEKLLVNKRLSKKC